LLLACAIIAAACSGSKKQPASAGMATVEVTATAASAPTATVAAQAGSLAAQIGVRGALPPNRPIDLAARYRRTDGAAPAAKPFVAEANIGDHRTFQVLKLTSGALEGKIPPDFVATDTVLLAKSAHAYFYEDVAISPDPADVQAAADMFETSVWPTVTGVFGEPAIPGVDGDPRIVVLQAGLGGAAGGYYSGDDEYLRAVRPLSNEAEMVYMDRTLKAGGASFNVVLAHEFQHLVHAKNDQDEESWVNEGLSETASGLVGGAVSSVNSFEAHPQTQLNGWRAAASRTTARGRPSSATSPAGSGATPRSGRSPARAATAPPVWTSSWRPPARRGAFATSSPTGSPPTC